MGAASGTFLASRSERRMPRHSTASWASWNRFSASAEFCSVFVFSRAMRKVLAPSRAAPEGRRRRPPRRPADGGRPTCRRDRKRSAAWRSSAFLRGRGEGLRRIPPPLRSDPRAASPSPSGRRSPGRRRSSPGFAGGGGALASRSRGRTPPRRRPETPPRASTTRTASPRGNRCPCGGPPGPTGPTPAPDSCSAAFPEIAGAGQARVPWRASPKSVTQSLPSLSRRRLEGLTSRWTMPCSWAA